MKHQTLEQLQAVAEVHPDQKPSVMTRSQRLQRWAELLESDPDRQLGNIVGHRTPARRGTSDDAWRRLGDHGGL